MPYRLRKGEFKMVVLVDNYDSFSYNLYQLMGSIRPDIRVIRNDQMTVKELEALQPEAIVLSPGPGRPEDAGICMEAVRELGGRIPVLGVCLGHQAICAAYGAKITYAKQLMHGKTSQITASVDSKLFAGLENPIQAARYHSLAAEKKSLPDCLKVTAITKDDEVMAVEHREYPVFGLQFHPESILTIKGKEIINNFFQTIGGQKHD